MTDTEDLVRQYKELSPAMSEKEKAELEHKIWDSRPPDAALGSRHKREVYLCSLLGGSLNDIALRAQLYNGGSVIDPIWARIEKDYTVSTGAQIMRSARKIATENSEESLRAAIAKVMREYDSRPLKRYLSDGKIARSNSPTRLPSMEEMRKQAIKPSVRRKPENPDNARAFYDELRKFIAGYVAPKLVGAPPIVGEQLYKDFERDLKVLLEAFQHKAYRVIKQERTGGLTEVHRRQVIESCRTLSIEPPKPGYPVDLERARKMQRKLAGLYHPDQHKGDESMRGLYQSVMEAFGALEQYNESLNNMEARNADGSDDE